jgi:hypothetical protein
LGDDEANAHWASISVHKIMQIYSKEADEPPRVDRKRWWNRGLRL